MSKFYIEVSVESETVENVSSFLSDFLGEGYDVGVPLSCLGVFFDVVDRTDVYASAFLAGDGLGAGFSCPEDVDMSKFGVGIDLYTATDSIGFNFIDVLGDAMAAKISSLLKRKVMLTIGESVGPLFIYDNGIRIYEFVDDYAGFFKYRGWYPKSAD